MLPYLLTHFRRDMQSLSAMLDALDRYSLETQRPITMPLLRELLQLGLPDTFIEHGDPAKLLALQGLDAAGIEAAIGRRWPDAKVLTA